MATVIRPFSINNWRQTMISLEMLYEYLGIIACIRVANQAQNQLRYPVPILEQISQHSLYKGSQYTPRVTTLGSTLFGNHTQTGETYRMGKQCKCQCLYTEDKTLAMREALRGGRDERKFNWGGGSLQAYQTRKETAKVRHEGIPAKLSLGREQGWKKFEGVSFAVYGIAMLLVKVYRGLGLSQTPVTTFEAAAGATDVTPYSVASLHRLEAQKTSQSSQANLRKCFQFTEKTEI